MATLNENYEILTVPGKVFPIDGLHETNTHVYHLHNNNNKTEKWAYFTICQKSSVKLLPFILITDGTLSNTKGCHRKFLSRFKRIRQILKDTVWRENFIWN